MIDKTISSITRQLHGDNLKARSSRGVLVLGVGTVVERVLRLARNMILARLLAPNEFGLMAIIIAASVAFEAFAEVGVRQSVIHSKKGDKAEYLNIAWWFQAVCGLGLFAVAYISAPWISHFYESAELLPLMRLTFIAILFRSLISPRAYALEKKIEFGKLVVLTQGSGLLGTLITLSLVFFVVRNVWALVIGFVAEAAFRCVLSFILCPFLPRLSIDRDSLSSMVRYARGMLGLSLLTIVALQTDIVVLGKVVTTEQLGMYSLALALAQQPTNLFFSIIGPVLLPAFAEKQDEKQALCRAVLKIMRATVLVGAPVTALLSIFSVPVLSVIYGSRYIAVALPFAIMCIAMLIRVHGSILSLIYQAIGKPHLHRRYVTLLVLLIISLIYPGIMLFGLAGAAGVLLLSYTVAVCMQVIWMRKPIGLRFKDYASCWLPISQPIGILGGR